MPTKNIYETYLLSKFYKEYNTSKKELTSNNHCFYRYLCFKYTQFIRHIDIPKIKKDLNYEAVLIEYRKFPHLEFLIRNTIIKLGKKWSHTIICGTKNYDFMVNMCEEISPNIKIIKTVYENLTPSEYSNLLTSLSFWDLFVGNKILIYQEDSIIFKNNVEDFLIFDFIGAPFPKSQNDTPNCVGNGGISIRTKNIMKQIIQTIDIEDTLFNNSTLEYMKYFELTHPPEDIYFSKNMQELNIGVVADWNTASMFSSESILNIDSFAGHKFWISNPKWKKFMNNNFQFQNYLYNNDIKKYLTYKNLSHNCDKTPIIKNAFDVDLYFCNIINRLNGNNENDILKYIKNIALNGYIYHPKQIINLYPNARIYNFMNLTLIENNLILYKAVDFVEKNIYNKSFDELAATLIKNIYNNLHPDMNLLLLVFIGNEKVGKILIEKIVSYKNLQDFNVAFCFNSVEVIKTFKYFIKENFTHYSIYLSNEMGTDITPTMLMYNDIYKQFSFKHIIKLHTKSIVHLFNDLTNDLLSVPLNRLVEKKRDDCNCIGHKNMYIDLKTDMWIKLSLINHYSQIDTNKKFVAGTIFYAENIVFDKVLKFMKTNSGHSYLLNNLYENNSINYEFSPIHFLERLFGIIKI